METSPDPAALGTYKKQFKVFSYEIGRKYRITCSVRRDDKTIEFVSVCDHKSVYGRG